MLDRLEKIAVAARGGKALLALALMLALAAAPAVCAEKRYAPGVSDAEIVIGQTMPYSGAASAWGADGLAELAYLKMINDQGGVNGRKIRLISLDDGYSPPKTVEQTRKLIEQDQVAFIFSSLGTAPNTAIQKYLNERKVPQLFVATGASKWADPAHFPWTMGWQPNYVSEARIYARYILEHKPEARIAVLYQNDDYGKDYLAGLKDGLGERYDKMVATTASYEVSDPTVDSEIVALQATGADVFVDIAGPKFAAQAIRRAYDIGWRPLHFLNTVGSAVGAVLQPAGLEKSVGIITARYYKDPTDPQWQDDPAFKDWLAWMGKYNPGASLADYYNVLGYNLAMTLVQVLKQCGDDLSRENVMRQAANLHALALPMLLPGITINTSPTDYRPIKQLRLVRFDGKTWEPFGEVIADQM
ncbi:MAG TPA: ABC transporter substrate-binding protein [Stellaceae bacterium]|nr:ABC transporter substrate-binding protein [Stellaceae bacterium]